MHGREALTALTDGRARPAWQPVTDAVAAIGPSECAARAATLNRRLAFETQGHERPARLDPIPFALTGAAFASLAAGLAARAAALAAILDDLYGPRRSFSAGHLPPEAVFASQDFIRPLAISTGFPSLRLTFYAADVLRLPDGQYRVIADHTDTLAGLGLAFAIRRLTTEILPELFGAVTLTSQRPIIESLQDMLHTLASGGPIGLLATDGADPGDAVLLARQLGGFLLRPDDLSCEGAGLTLRTLAGATPLRLLLRLGRAIGIDPLEQGGPPAGGIPGLFHCLRSGAAVMLNAPGSALVASPTLAPLIEPLAVSTHADALRRGETGEMSGEQVPCAALRAGHEANAFVPGRAILRLHAVRIDDQWRLLPGGLARTTMPDGTCRLKDIWIIEDGEAAPHSAGPARRMSAPPRPCHVLPARLAEDLLWLGRMTERLATATHLLGLVLPRFVDASALPHEVAQRRLLARCLVSAGLLDEEEAGPFLSARALRAALGRKRPVSGLCREIRRLLDACAMRFSTAMRALIEPAFDDIGDLAAGQIPPLPACARFVATFNGAIAEHTARNDAFVFIEIGRRLERAEAMAEMLAILLDGPAARLDPGLSVAIELADATLVYESMHAGPIAPGPALALLLTAPEYPRSLAFQTTALAMAFARIGAAEERIAHGLTTDLDEIVASEAAPGAALAAFATRIQSLAAAFEASCFAPLPPAYQVGDKG